MKKEPSTELELIPSATTASIIHGIGIALRAGGVSLLPAVTRTQRDAGGHALAEDRIYLFTTTGSKKMFFSSDRVYVERPKMEEHNFLSSMPVTWREEEVASHMCGIIN